MAKRFLSLERSEWGFWGLWVLANIVGWAVGGAVSLAVGGAGAEGLTEAEDVAVSVVGLLAGIAQWLVLRKRVERSGWWVLASALGWAAGRTVAGALIWVEARAGVGLVVGIAQWLLLRKQVERSGWWVLASALGWAIGWTVAGAVSGAVARAWVRAVVRAGAVVGVLGLARALVVLSWGVSGLVHGTLTGPALVLLLRHPIPKSSEADA
jgi:hypothetical protein